MGHVRDVRILGRAQVLEEQMEALEGHPERKGQAPRMRQGHRGNPNVPENADHRAPPDRDRRKEIHHRHLERPQHDAGRRAPSRKLVHRPIHRIRHDEDPQQARDTIHQEDGGQGIPARPEAEETWDIDLEMPDRIAIFTEKTKI